LETNILDLDEVYIFVEASDYPSGRTHFSSGPCRVLFGAAGKKQKTENGLGLQSQVRTAKKKESEIETFPLHT